MESLIFSFYSFLYPIQRETKVRKGFEPLHDLKPPNGFRIRPLQPDLGNAPKIRYNAYYILKNLPGKTQNFYT